MTPTQAQDRLNEFFIRPQEGASSTITREFLITKATFLPKEPPPRPCGCRTWFQTVKECPYCKARILRGRVEK
jgi:hypothetical protein